MQQNNMNNMTEHAVQNNMMTEPQKRYIPEGYMTSQEAARLFNVTRGRAQYILKEKNLDYYVVKNDRNNVHVYKEDDVWEVYVRRCAERRVKPEERRSASQNMPISAESKLH